MNLDQVEKKLLEARFFLDRMVEQERQAFGDKEPFDYYLSAFLSAARTVDYRLRHEQPALYPGWRKTWDGGLSAVEAQLIKFMVDDRNVEVHESGSSRGVKTEKVPVFGNEYEDDSSIVHVFGPPDMPPATIQKPAYHFTIAGTERKATETCGAYLTLLNQMVSKFKSDHP